VHGSPETSENNTIWLVEDNDQFRNGITEVINRASGLECPASFADCEGTLKALEQKDAPEVILMDIGLPGMSGIEGTRLVKRLSPATDVIMLTVYDDDDKVFQAICAGATGYLLKDSPPESIVSAIRDVLAGGAPINAHIARRMLEMFNRVAAPKGEYGLTNREKEVLSLLTEGMTKKQIAEKLFLSYFTVDTHLRNIYAKLHVHSRSGAIAKVLKEQIL